MAKVTLKGNEIHTNGELPKVGAEARLERKECSDKCFPELGYKCMCGLGKTLQ